MEAHAMFAKVVSRVSDVFERLQPEDYARSTPDTEWDIHALTGHMIYEISWVPDMIAGRTIEEVGDAFEGDLVGSDAAASWQQAAGTALQAVQVYDPKTTAHMSYADTPAEDYLRQVSGDLLIHGWDLAVALGLQYRMDPDVAEIVYKGMSADINGLENSGLFKPPLTVDEDADVQTKLLALSGRDPGWAPRSAS